MPPIIREYLYRKKTIHHEGHEEHEEHEEKPKKLRSLRLLRGEKHPLLYDFIKV